MNDRWTTSRIVLRGAGLGALALAVAGALWIGGTDAVRAEVAAEVDDDGTYRRTVVLGNASTRNLRVWAVTRAAEHTVPLNPDGDLNGDLWPAILEVPHDDFRPWVLWSRFNGTDYDLAWSRWQAEGGWTEISWVTLTPAMPGDDLDPSLDYAESDGRPYVVWTNATEAGGEIYLSMFLASQWMQPYRVSDVDEDAAYPTVTVIDDETIEVTYETPAGPRTRIVRFMRPTTITDDANPFEYFKMDDPDAGTLSEADGGP